MEQRIFFKMELSKEMLKNWIVEDLTELYSTFDNNRYSIFEDNECKFILIKLQDNIKSLLGDQ